MDNSLAHACVEAEAGLSKDLDGVVKSRVWIRSIDRPLSLHARKHGGELAEAPALLGQLDDPCVKVSGG